MMIAIADPGGEIREQLVQLRMQKGRRVLTLGEPANLLSELERQLCRYDDIVIDVGSDDSSNSRTALIAPQRVVISLRANQIYLPTQHRLIARLNAARMFNPGLSILFVVLCGAIDPSTAEMAAIRSHVAQVMSAKLASVVVHLPDAVAAADRSRIDSVHAYEMQTLYGEVFSQKPF